MYVSIWSRLWYDCFHYDYSAYTLGSYVMIKAAVRNGPFTVTKATSKKGIATVTIDNYDKAHVGIQRAELTINCGSEVAAADLLAYLARDFNFTLVLKDTYEIGMESSYV